MSLIDAARRVREAAYAPYSGFKVGAAVRGASGAIYAGCNVENVAYPEGTCAEAGAIAVVLEMVPAELATQITGKLTIPTVGIGAGANCDAQVLVWQDMAGMTAGKTAKFVKRFGDVGAELGRAARQYAAEVASSVFPAEEHSY